MFTGLVEALGEVRAVESDGAGGVRLTVAEPRLAPELVLGESVAVSGACLTVVHSDVTTFHFEVSPETLRKTSLGALRAGDRVNLERAARLGDHMGGHLVQGHVDGVGQLAERRRDGDWEMFWFACPTELTDQMVPKGSVCVDGISLTVVDVEACRFSVALIPHTLAVTTLGAKPIGGAVNVETDIVAKYIAKQVAAWRRA